MTLGEQLRELRVNTRLSQRDLSEIARVPHPRISGYENDHHIPSLPVLVRLLTGLNAWAEVWSDGVTLHKASKV